MEDDGVTGFSTRLRNRIKTMKLANNTAAARKKSFNIKNDIWFCYMSPCHLLPIGQLKNLHA
jgi:hypothetical protein